MGTQRVIRLLLVGVVGILAMSAHAAVYTVTNAGDAATGGTLRWAIRSAETNPGADEVRFNLHAPYTIQPTGALPVIYSHNVTIDGSTQPGYLADPLVNISGGGTTAGSGLELSGCSGAVIRAVQVSGWPDDGIAMAGHARHATVEGCWLMSNKLAGISLAPAHYVTVGGASALSKNVISSNYYHGVYNTGSNNVILACYIGCDPSGLSAMPNGGSGIFEEGHGTTIGSTSIWARNVISGNHDDGIHLNAVATNATVIGNYIGTDFAGSGAVGNGVGIKILGRGNLIGGGGAGTTNLIAGNTLDGIRISGSSASGNRIEGNLIGINPNGLAIPNENDGVNITVGAHQNYVGGTTASRRNIISGNSEYGVSIVHITFAATGNVVRGNYIGTDIAGTNRVPNGYAGVYVCGRGSVIGGSSANDGNLISGNGTHGVWLDGTNAANSRIQNNLIGVNATASAAVSNGSHGIYVNDAPDVLIGGTNDGNIVSGNGQVGINVTGAQGGRATIQGNIVGADGVTASVAIPNGSQGISIADGHTNVIGGTGAGRGNLVSGNRGAGIALDETAGNRIVGNLIGVNATAVNPLGNGSSGISISFDAIRNTIEGNIVGANGEHGISIMYTSAVDNVVRGNWIGTDALGLAQVGNAGRGIRIYRAPSNTIGGLASGEGNLIANNARPGITVSGEEAVGNRLLGNECRNNGCLGISLIEADPNCVITTNDPGDADSGGNRLQNYPVLASVTNAAAILHVRGTLDSTPNSTFWVQLFGATECMAHGHGEGEMYLGVVTVRTDVAGVGGFTNALSISPPSTPSFVTALATDTNRGDTSEFSRCLILDRDRDGMADGWEVEWFGTITGGDPAGHLDADTIPNLDEFIADTNPSDPESYLRASIAQTDEGMAISISSSAHRQYDFIVSPDWFANPSVGSGTLDPNAWGNGGTLTRTDTTMGAGEVYGVRARLP